MWSDKDSSSNEVTKVRDHRVLSMAPMAVPATAIIAGIVLDQSQSLIGTRGWAAFALVGLTLAAIETYFSVRTFVGVVVAFVSIGAAWHHFRASDLNSDDIALIVTEEMPPQPVWIRGVVLETPTYRPDSERPNAEGSSRTVVGVTSIYNDDTWLPVSGKIATWVGGNRTDLEPGRPIHVAGSLGPIEGPLNPGERDARASWRAEGVRLRLVAGSSTGIWDDPEGTIWPFTFWLGKVRAWSYNRLVSQLDTAIAPLAAALLLGRREGVDPELNDAFARTGTTHLLAISGLHLQALAVTIWLICKIMGVHRRPTWWIVMLCSIAYAILVGLAPSVTRSLGMTVVACLAGLLERPPRLANLMSLTVLLTVALNPLHVFDIGCQLSFLAVAAILWATTPAIEWLKFHARLSDPIQRRYEPFLQRYFRRFVTSLLEGTTVSVIVWSAALPLVAQRFHITSPVSILLNLPLVPITSLAMIMAGLSLVLATICSPLAVPAAWSCRVLLQITDVVVRWGARQTWAYGFGPGPGETLLIAFYVLLAIAALASFNGGSKWVQRIAWSCWSICLVVVVIVPWFPRRLGQPEAEVIAVGHGLSVLVRSSDGHALLYDAGRMAEPHVGRRLIAPLLWQRGVSRLDTVILSHADSDHYNGLDDLLERFAIGEVLTPPGFATEKNPGAVRLIEHVKDRKITLRTIVAGDRWKHGDDLDIRVLHPSRSADEETSDNARSVVLDLQSNGHRLLLTGDLEGPGLAELTGNPPFPIDVFLAPHHGGRASNPIWVYEWAKPQMVVSSQRKPTVGSRDALDLIAEQGFRVWRTWNHGAIRLRWTTGGIDATNFLNVDHSSQ